MSFVGVDINVCSEVLLRYTFSMWLINQRIFNLFLLVKITTKIALYFRRVAGLNVARAKKIVDWREKNGPFQCREQLKTISGIGPKTYEQCAGFVRVLPETRTSAENGYVNF